MSSTNEASVSVSVSVSAATPESVTNANEVSVERKENPIENAYLTELYTVMTLGEKRPDRTGVGTYSLFGRHLSFDLTQGFPLLTTKKLPFRHIVHELFWFLSGSTSTEYLKQHGVKIWEKNSSEAFLRSRGLDYPDGHVGPLYGFQWRNFGGNLPSSLGGLQSENRERIDQIDRQLEILRTAPAMIPREDLPRLLGGLQSENRERIDEIDRQLEILRTAPAMIPREDLPRLLSGADPEPRRGVAEHDRKGVDQIARVLEILRTDPTSRRMVISAWNPCDLDKMALEPCHVLFQLYVREGKYLDGSLYMRSNDLFLGAPWNIACYSLLISLYARLTGYTPGRLVYTVGDAHVYTNHLEQVGEQIQREPRAFPRLVIRDRGQQTFEDFVPEDITIEDYDPWPAIRAPMAA